MPTSCLPVPDLAPLADVVHRDDQPLLYLPDGLGLDAVNVLASDPEDRWLDDFGGGLAVLDCDGDGDADLFFATGGSWTARRTGSCRSPGASRVDKPTRVGLWLGRSLHGDATHDVNVPAPARVQGSRR